jgi:hypothetical protein
MVRKYRRGQLLQPLGENMFWAKYKVIDYVRYKVTNYYHVTCYPHDSVKHEITTMPIAEAVIDAIMEPCNEI